MRDISSVLTLGLSGAKSQSLVLRLLINELGGIDAVKIEDENLALSIRQLVANAFAKIKFNLGKIDNISVKSQLRIEVALEATGTS